MDDRYIDEMASLGKDNFWFRAKRKFVSYWVQDDGFIVEVGCGAGNNLMPFKKAGQKILGVDISDTSIEYCRKVGINAIKKDLSSEKLELAEKARYILILDFIEHLQYPEVFMKNLTDISTQKTELIITVPAHQFLFSNWDLEMQHYRRYSKKTLVEQVENAGWKITHITYTHTVLYFVSLIARKVSFRKEEKKETFFNPSLFWNNFLYFLYFPEFILFKLGVPIPFGLSIMAKATLVQR